LLASAAVPHLAPLGWVTTGLNLIQIPCFAPWQDVRSGHKAT
jgi:hypothetical protein